jgi:hypothetical protein
LGNSEFTIEPLIRPSVENAGKLTVEQGVKNGIRNMQREAAKQTASPENIRRLPGESPEELARRFFEGEEGEQRYTESQQVTPKPKQTVSLEDKPKSPWWLIALRLLPSIHPTVIVLPPQPCPAANTPDPHTPKPPPEPAPPPPCPEGMVCS